MADEWGYCVLKLPNDPALVVPGRRHTLAGSELGVTYRGAYTCHEGDQPDEEITLHFKIDPSAPAGTVKQNVAYLTTPEWERLREREQTQGGSATSTGHGGSNGTSTVVDKQAADALKRHFEEAQDSQLKRPKPRCEQLLDTLTSSSSGDGIAMQLVKLLGKDVPQDQELYFCQRTHTTLQVRVKTLIERDGLVHDYEDLAGKNGIYDLKCTRSDHHLLVKVQPPLGLKGLLPAYDFGIDPTEVKRLLHGKLQALLGLFNALLAFLRDATKETILLTGKQGGSGLYTERLAEHPEIIAMVIEKCPVLVRGESGTPSLRLTEHTRPKSRGMLLKAFFEVKVLVIQTACKLFRLPRLAAEDQEALEIFQAYMDEDCCPGGPDAQCDLPEDSMKRLRMLICGDFRSYAQDEAWATLRECVGLAKGILGKLRNKDAAADLEPPKMGSIGQDGTEFKNNFNKVFERAMTTYLYDTSIAGYTYGPQVAIAMMRKQWMKPDEALKVICPNETLDECVKQWEVSFDTCLNTLMKRSTANGVSTEQLGGLAVGLDNPGENLCATNSLMQLLYSINGLREAVLAVPADAPSSSSTSQPASSGRTDAEASAKAAHSLVGHVHRLFSALSDKTKLGHSPTARDVALVLYDAKESLGAQQDCDELLHRFWSLLDDGFKEAPDEKYKTLRQRFEKLFMGATYELQVRPASASASNGKADFKPVAPTTDREYMIGFPLAGETSNKKFLSIPVQQENQTLTAALDDFTSWSHAGGSDVIWTQEQFRLLPPLLCFTSRQVSTLEWEETLNLTPFAARPTHAVQRDRLERNRLQHVRCKLVETATSLSETARRLSDTDSLDNHSMKAEVQQLEAVKGQIESKQASIDGQLRGVEERIGDGLEDPPISDFLKGIVDTAVIDEKVCGLLGVNTVKKLADVVLGPGGSDDVLTGIGLEATQVRSILEKLKARAEKLQEHLYDVYAVVVYMGRGMVGHYVSFIRQADGCFFCFDDEIVTRMADVAALRKAIEALGSESQPASLRTLVYRRRCADGSSEAAPLQLLGPSDDVTAASADEPCNGSQAKRQRTQ
eukprot:TRINITY_DN36380_c0_g1_i1.p1 TRINITY_DN36380_c0_g1~~TRINITY_DN36380_c0_g1_i1.p1  ORF type:complete len:1069 (+),score=201.58 TRINITY_DN36380_c0_g1_i1:185-3391(+)